MAEPTSTSPPLYPAPKPQGLAVVSLVLGIISCTMCLNILFIPSLLAIVFGTISLTKVRRGIGGGKGLALAGLICGIAGIAFCVLLVFLLWCSDRFMIFTLLRQMGISRE